MATPGNRVHGSGGAVGRCASDRVGKTADDDDRAVGVLSPEAARRLAGFPLGETGHCACVEHEDIGSFRSDRRFVEQAGHHRGLVLVGTTTEGDDLGPGIRHISDGARR